MSNSIFPFIDVSNVNENAENEEIEELCEYAFDLKTIAY